MSHEYANILIHIYPRMDKNGLIYPVDATLDDGSYYGDGQMQLSQQDQEILRAHMHDAEQYGHMLFNALFSGSIRDAYNKVTGRAESQREGRLRVRLWIDEKAAELHTICWERLYHKLKGQMAPLAASELTSFSRYVGLSVPEPRPVTTSPIRLLVVISNPPLQGLRPIDVEGEVKSLRKALRDLRHKSHIHVTLMPGQSGLSPELRAQLEQDGYEIENSVASLDNILQFLTENGINILHILSHGFFRPQDEHNESTAALCLEKDDKSYDIVKDDDLVSRLVGAGLLPHLVFLSACESARQDEHAFVGLGPKLIKAGVPAVVAMQDRIPMDVAQQFTADFYRNLVKHGVVDEAINQARFLLFDRNTTYWSIPVLFMRLRSGRIWSVATTSAARFNVPELPLHYVPREGDLRTLKQKLLVETGEKEVRVGMASRVVLHGMEGSGKSVLAAALVEDEEIKAAFSDGVFWVTVGREPLLTSLQALLVQGLSAQQLIFTDTQRGIAELSKLLEQKVCLLILDDVWRLEHVEAFGTPGPGVRVLITTRYARLIVGLGAFSHHLSLLTNEQALTLLAAASDQEVERLPIQAQQVAQECGNLPLALAMSGAIARGRPERWDNVLHKLKSADLAKISQQFPRYLYPNLLRAIQASVDELEVQDRERYLDFGVFYQGTPIPESVLQMFWVPQGLDKYDTQDVLDRLVDRSLATRDEWGQISLHDLQLDYVRKQVESTPGGSTNLHNRLSVLC